MALAFRILVLCLAVGFFIDRALVAEWDAFGAMFRYLTVWALTGNLIAAALMLVPRLGAPDGAVPGRLDGALSALAVLNALVVFSYWRLFFTDPTLVNGTREIAPVRDLYLHLVGPALMWADLFAIRRGFRRVLPAIAGLAALIAAYALWAELLVAPNNTAPVGSVATGLPYPFLNDMALPERLVFYGTILLTGLVLVALFRGIAWLRDRGRAPKRDRPQPSSASKAARPAR